MEKRLLWGRNREFYFYDMYVERFLSSFYRTGKIIDTLEAVASGFPPGSMKNRESMAWDFNVKRSRRCGTYGIDIH